RDPREEFAEVAARARFQQAERLLASGGSGEAAAAFLALADADPRDRWDLAAPSLNNAGVALERAGRHAEAARAFERLAAEHPASPLAAEALLRAGLDAERAFEFERALGAWERLATDPRHADSPHRADALWNAAALLERDGAFAAAA